MKTVQIHPYATIFPAFNSEERDALRKSISERGQIHPITVYDGKILDGRHRYDACVWCGIKPAFTVFRGTPAQALDFVQSVNMDRRHLSEAQRSMVAAKIAEARFTANLRQNKEGLSEPSSQTESTANLRRDTGATETEERKQAAEEFNVSLRSVETAAKVIAEAPAKIVKAVEKGEMSLNAAAQAIKPAPDAEEETVDVFGKTVPGPLCQFWFRRGEIVDLMKSIAAVQNKIQAAQKERDALLSGAEFSDAALDLAQAHTRIRSAQLYCLCPYCQGRQREKCTFCKKRGFVSKDKYELVPVEARRLNEKTQ